MTDGDRKSGNDESPTVSVGRRPILGAAGAVAASGVFSGVGSASTTTDGFDPIDATAFEIRTEYERGTLSVEEVVRSYLDRIAEFEDDLQAVISINPHAIDRAVELDEALESDEPPGRGPPDDREPPNGQGPPGGNGPPPFDGSDELVGPLHGIPVLVKDNVNTDDIPTTTGTVAMEDMVPPESATIATQIRDAGGIIIAKANMDEFAFGYTSSSSMGGTVYNPYDLDRTAGGSSGGSGAGIAANYAPLGIGTDTGGSVRVPSLANNLVGLRPTRQLVSNNGVSPLHSSQDVPGPMTTTVEDAALLLDVLAGADPNDPLTLESAGRTPHAEGNQYVDALNEDGLDGARLGVYSDWMPDGDDNADIAALFEDAVVEMEHAGATLVRDLEPPSDAFVSDSYRGGHTHKDWNNYLEPIEAFEDLEALVATGELEHCWMANTLTDPDTLEELEGDLDFVHPYFEQNQLQQYILGQLHEHDLDAILYPGNWDVPPVDSWGSWGPANLHLSPVLDWPAIVVPVGFADNGAPVGMEFLGPMWSEPTLLELTYAYEQRSDPREPPAAFGPIEGSDIDWDADAIAEWNADRPVYNTVGECDIPRSDELGIAAKPEPHDEEIDTRNLPR